MGRQCHGGYLRHRYRLRPKAATRLVDRAQEVIDILPAIGQAIIDGRADVEQADVIVTGMEQLPGSASPTQCDAVLDELLDRCATEDPLELSRSATKAAEELTLVSEDGEPPDDDEPAAHARRHLHLRPKDGGTEISGWAPADIAAAIAAYLTARSQPDDAGHGDPTDPDGKDTRNTGQRHLDALAEACGHAATCPQTPAPAVPAVLVTLDYHALTGRLSGGTLLDTGQPLPASLARRMCCEAALIPTVLDGQTLPLDLGRGQRLFTTTQRTALALRDRGCTFPGCDQPPVACHAHHLTEWQAHTGPTSLDNGALLCPHHHRTVHRHRWTGRIGPHGRPQYIPPPWIDPQQKPRHHIRYQLNKILRP